MQVSTATPPATTSRFISSLHTCLLVLHPSSCHSFPFPIFQHSSIDFAPNNSLKPSGDRNPRARRVLINPKTPYKMSNENSPPPTPSSPSARRSSFSPGQTFSDMFGRSPTSVNSGTTAYPGPIATAAANAQAQQRRRTSISALGLGSSPTQSIFAGARARAESWSSNGNGSIDESAIEEGDAPPSTSPSSTFGRRLSFGARALRDARAGNGNNNGRTPTDSTPSPAGRGRGLSSSQASAGDYAKRLSNQFNQRSGEGFTWSEQLRSRAERSSSITSPTSAAPPASAREPPRTAPVAAAEPPPQKPAKKERPVPDHFQERILKGDFYMD